MMVRDFQKSKVYAAEEGLWWLLDHSVDDPQVVMGGSTLVLSPEAKFSTPEDVQRYVDQVLAHPAVVERFGHSQVSVRKRKGVTKAHYERLGQVIAVPDDKWALRELVVLHELAHHFTLGGASHGPIFAGTYIDLVGMVMGFQTQLALRILFGDNDVKVS
jgi:putative metallohydrolase (TIGR04338 family)